MNQCIGTKTDGDRCTKRVSVPGTLCHIHGETLVVAEYNVLADYLGSNYLPWFWYEDGLLTEEERSMGKTLYYQAMDNQYWKQKDLDQPFDWLDNLDPSSLTTDQIAVLEKIATIKDTIIKYENLHFVWNKPGCRGYKIVKKLLGYDPDLIILAELDMQHVKTLSEKLGNEYSYACGFDDLYQQRPLERSQDGSAIFYRKDKLECVTSNGFHYEKDGLSSPNRSGLISLFKTEQGKELIVVATHLMSQENNPRFEQTRILQIDELMRNISQFIRLHSLDENIQVIVAGDFNSIAYGDAYNTMVNYGYHSSVLNSVVEELDDPNKLYQRDEVYPHDDGKPATTKTLDRYTWIDYIWVKNINYKRKNKIPISDPDEVWPDADHPSDHEAISTTLYL
jgi:endonuclease/exonuclease/phosphatase family metal-dependent hydrolase